jgi:hypothetical protein
MRIENLSECPIIKVGNYAFLNCFNNTAWRLKYAGYIASWIGGMTVAVALFCFGLHGLGTSIMSLPAAVMVETIGMSETAAIATGYVLGIVGMGAGAAGGTFHGMALCEQQKEFLKEIQKQNTDEKINFRWMATKHTANLFMPYLKIIGEGAFKNCKYLGGITVSGDITSIPDFAF